MFQIGLLEPVPTLHGKFCNLFLRTCDILWNAICYYWTKRYSSWGQWETLHRPSAYSEIWRQIIIWVPHSNCRLQMNVTVKWSHQTCVWNWAAGRVLRGDIWKIMIIAYRLLRVFNLLLEAVRTPTQPFRSTESHFAQIFFSVFTNESLHGKESVDRNAVRRQLGDTISMWDVYYQPVNWHALIFFHSHFCTLSCFTTPSLHLKMRGILRSWIVIGRLAWKSAFWPKGFPTREDGSHI